MENTSISIKTTLNPTRKRKWKQSQNIKDQGLLDVVLSWSLSDVLNKHLYKSQVKEVPLSFSTTSHYMDSFKYLLLEETHADLLSQLAGICQAPTSRIFYLKKSQTTEYQIRRLYVITLCTMSRYSPKVGDLIALTQVKPKCIDDLHRLTSPFIIAYVNKLIDRKQNTLEIMSSGLIDSCPNDPKKLSKGFFVYLTNLTTNMRIWNALKPAAGNMNIIEKTSSFFSPLELRSCDRCSSAEEKGAVDSDLRQAFDSFKLNSSQEAAVLSCLAANKCFHQNWITLIWGPPGTGKTKTLASLLFVLLRTKHRTVTSAPTNIAVVGVVKRLLSLIRDHDLGCGTYGLGDIVLFGNEGRMEINDDRKQLQDVFLDYRIDALMDCLSLWKCSLNEMISLLGRLKIESTSKDKEEFSTLRKKLISCISSLCTHLPTSVLSLEYANKMYHFVDLLQKVDRSLMEMEMTNGNKSEVLLSITECLQALIELQVASRIPSSMNRVELHKIRKSMLRVELESFCLRNACLIFCTASNSIKLRRNGMTPIELVLIDEAAQLKECESLIPLTLPGVRNAVLVGDERQLPSMVQSKICEEAKFGRSLFERMVLLGHKKHLLNVQYRMHPAISRFPNTEFYDGMILDGPNVMDRPHEKSFLEGVMYGSYSFINVDSAKEEVDNNNSMKNMLEVTVITEIVANLFRESVEKKQKVTVGCLSPYKAQVDAIQEKLSKYNLDVNDSYFSVKVRSIDGFQGSEEDVIIFSTVRCNCLGSVGFFWSRERANVALTRARHCLWIVGNKETMTKSGSVWNTLVFDAEDRGCVYNATDDKNLANAMVHAMVELAYFDSLLTTNSILFKESKWKVTFADVFLERIYSIANLNIRKLVVSLLVKLSSGWCELRGNSRNRYFNPRGMCNLFETYFVHGQLYLVWSVDIAYENSLCFQVLKFWDILPLHQIEQCALYLERVIENYTWDTINRCQTKHFERNRVLPITWHMDSAHDPTRCLRDN